MQEAQKIMRHSRRHILTTQDIEAAFKKLTIKETYGYPSSTALTYQKVNQDNQNLWFIKPNKINLKEFIERP